MSFSPTLRKEFHVDFSDPGCNVRVIAASGDAGVADFRRNPALDAPGFYIAIDREQGYVGGAGTSVSFRSSRFTDGAHLPPDLMLGIVGAQTRLEPAQAFALERIAYQALQRSGWRMRNGSVPGGEPLDDEGYRAVQLFWSGVVALLRPAFPSIACPWTGPEYLDASGVRDPYGQRRRASMLGLVASVRSDDAGW